MKAKYLLQMGKVCLFLSIVIALLQLPLFPQEDEDAQERPRLVIAVTEFRDLIGDPQYDYLKYAIPLSLFIKLGTYSERVKLVERMQLDKLLEEMALAKVGLVTQTPSVEIGEMVPANALLIGAYWYVGDQIRVNSRVIDIETSEIIVAAEVAGRMEDLFTLVDQLAVALVEELSGEKISALQEDNNTNAIMNQSPTASFSWHPSSPTVGNTVLFDASASTDADGYIISYEWDFNRDGIIDKRGRVVTYTFLSKGSHLVSLKVTDSQGATGTTHQEVNVKEGQKIELGQLNISTDPPSAMLFVDGEYVGRTPLSMRLKEGSYDIILIKDGYKKLVMRIQVEANRQKEVFYQLLKKQENLPPIAVFNFSPSVPVENEKIKFDASNSTDRDGFITKYLWDFDEDGVVDAWGREIYQELPAGVHTVTLTVVDNDEKEYRYQRTLWVRKRIILENSMAFSPSGLQYGSLSLGHLSVFGFDLSFLLRLKRSGFDDLSVTIHKGIIERENFSLFSTTTLSIGGPFNQSVELKMRTENLDACSRAEFDKGGFSTGSLQIGEINVGNFALSGDIAVNKGGFESLGFNLMTNIMMIALVSQTVFDVDGFSFQNFRVNGIRVGSFMLNGSILLRKTGFDKAILQALTQLMEINLQGTAEFDAYGFHQGQLSLNKAFEHIRFTIGVNLTRDYWIGFLAIRFFV